MSNLISIRRQVRKATEAADRAGRLFNSTEWYLSNHVEACHAAAKQLGTPLAGREALPLDQCRHRTLALPVDEAIYTSDGTLYQLRLAAGTVVQAKHIETLARFAIDYLVVVEHRVH